MIFTVVEDFWQIDKSDITILQCTMKIGVPWEGIAYCRSAATACDKVEAPQANICKVRYPG